ncbi:MAG: amino acid adenylation domain-containing protein, partial [Candidatus Aminicenantes bacterium]|nr:amino acid adenylation domain-containing protein [Candidatus Aminicenantes bacterium]
PIDPAQFLEILKNEKITVLNQTPSAFYNLASEALKHTPEQLSLRYIIFGGEALNPVKLKGWQEKHPAVKLINMFGITETTVHVTYKEIGAREVQSNTSNIGKPIPTLSAYVMNSHQELLPAGIPGELCVGGLGVGRGYLNRPGLTREKFVPNPYKPGETLYRSGDLVRIHEDGNMDYLGRIDQQVQIRGFRVEPGEIEARLLERENIKEAVVVAVGEEKKDRLCAYIVSDGEIDTAVLREFLQQTLPDYMIPNYFMKVEKIPLTANGKVDRRALPDPEVKPAGEYIPPGSELEEQLVEIWKEVLNLNQVGIKDNYFYVGGDSIVAIRLVSAMNKSLAANLKIADLYTCQTIAGLSRFMQQDKEKSLPDARRETLEKIAGLALRVKAIHPKPEEIEMVFPMGDVQTGMLFYYLKEPAALYHDQISYHVRYEIFDTGKIKQALGLMAQKHPVLRSSFNLEELAQIVHKEPIIALHSYDISHLERAEQEQHVNNYTRENRGKYFDMTVPPLWRLTVFSLGAKNYVICAEVHHVISDGWSNALFFTELNNTYMQLLKEPGFKPAPLKSNYDVYITEQFVEKNKLMAAEKTADYWRNELEDYKRLDFPGAAGETGASPGSEKFVLDLGRSFLEQVNDFAVKNNTQLKNLCFAAYVYMLNMLSYENDLVVGLVANNRPEIEDSDKILGCFLNTIPVRVKTPAGIAWLEYIKEIDRKMLELKKYDKLSLAEIMKITGEKTRDGNPLFDTYFNFVNFYAFKQMDLAGADVYIPDPLKLTDHERTNTIFDFGINITRDSFLILLPYSSEVISGETVENLCGYFREILHRFIENPQGKIDKNSIISKAEKKKLLQDLNRTTAEYPREKTIYRLFREQARKNPENIALSTQNAAQEAGQEPETANCLFTYRELEKKSTRLAYHLKEKGVKPGIIAAVMVERSAAMITALLGILAAGGAYLPIDPAYPADRISYMLADSETKLILTTKRTFGTGEKVGKWTGEKVFLDSPVEVEAGDNFTPDEAGTGLRPAPGPGDPAYAIYTSGSTGKPKGVMIEQRNVVNFISGMTQRIPFEPGSAVLALTTISFDIFVLETLLPLSSGLNVVLATEKHQGDPELLKKFISANNISIMQLTPSRLNMLLGSGKEAGGTTIPAVIRTLIVGGEEFPQDLFQRLKQVFSGRIFNVYGPTETTVWSTIKELTAVEKVTIGTPILNTRIYIVDKNNQMLPFGCTGELCIGGEGVGKGYVNLPATTKEKFFKDPALEEGWIYKTGDLARWLPDGDIEFSGRIDYQVKVRGFRIELEEIESRLLKNDAVEKAVVLARTGKDGDKYLCAYIVAGAEVSVSRLRSYLLEKLPYYMIPSHFIRMDEVPLTQNRKVDRQALLNYEGTKIETGAVYVSPASDLEKEIAHIWEEVLGIKKVGIQDNFFDVGGNSLNIIQVSSRLKQAFQREVPVLTLFEHPTISALLAYIEQDKEEILSKQAKEREALERAGESLEETVQLFDQD